MSDKQTKLQQLLEEGYRAYPQIRDMLALYEEANEHYQRALDALSPKYVIVDSDSTNPITPECQ